MFKVLIVIRFTILTMCKRLSVGFNFSIFMVKQGYNSSSAFGFQFLAYGMIGDLTISLRQVLMNRERFSLFCAGQELHILI